MGQKTILIITDGVGYSPKTKYNAFYQAKKPTYDWMFEHLPHSLIKTYGMNVGLPEGQMGNSEVGHMCIGAGRILYQDLVKISLAFKNNEITENLAFKSLCKNSQTIHLCGLCSDGGVHSHLDHLLDMATMLEKMGKKVWLHLISDGRDVLPKSAKKYLEKTFLICSENIKIATLSGRFYAMDRDKRWDRIKLAYESIVEGKNQTSLSPIEYVDKMYAENITDEFILPICFSEYSGIEDEDGFVFINFRSDRAREIVEAIGDVNFKEFIREKNPKIYLTTMTPYDKKFSYPVLFPKDKISNTLAEVISNANLTQGHTAETEKYAHITFFLNGGIEEPFVNETRVLIPSPKVNTYDLCPEMSAKEVSKAVRDFMELGTDFIVVNFANGDMVGHTGNMNAAIKAVETIDKEIGNILEMAKKLDYAIVITSDHGNCEEMKDDEGNMLTNHTIGDVYCFVMGEGVSNIKNGGLDNIAPTVLKLMGLSKPDEMSEALF
ncbi:2,3-bisphosphoglycerate-independent phosphoglycerate mutase [Helicobacter cappadocius]|uniref:2,3-bisphosphoglycerate-independent phosphoglycerate mutase n=1 Tax=Helicobacter cappadocius TaxID=3063998 RepID=A0AA90PS86_9HELI|nr:MULTISPECIES: 2,3-bisphosphoglycerate-independent phosphoglycerate mutase [unclassified Helicobacter]MDO7253279.1 2,3-bisphosphoglycerate-independent phosphoglycerate mutase [Helicobacter sp. faydin-H75]MDP2539202.1 2,3-bisphosphoglycerate-independent phosphoglycerate mutase [Helicobacter sp. faydin-H76]